MAWFLLEQEDCEEWQITGKNRNEKVFFRTLVARQSVAGSHFKEDEAGDLGGGASATLAHLDTLSPQTLRATTRPSRNVENGG